MKLDSKYFDSIRISPRKEEVAPKRAPSCQWNGCASAGTHRAPRGRGRDGEYFHFCMDHVRQFNANYNYFQGMSDEEVASFQKSAVTGHRPTWKLGENAAAAGREPPPGPHPYARFAEQTADPHQVFGRGRAHPSAEEAPRRVLRTLERKALDKLHLPDTADKAEIKARFKALVKQHHPDANGGDRGAEEKLREIIQAYNYLKQAGLV